MSEIWKDILGYEGIYKISNAGRIYSYKTKRYLTGRLNNKGYRHVCLSKNKKVKDVLIHRLVAIAFLDNSNNLPIVNHKDENPLNNTVENLEWCTQTYNVGYSLNLHPERRCRKDFKESPKYRKHNKKIIMFNKEMEKLCEFQSMQEMCNERNYNTWSIIQCCNGNRKTAYGYKWKFAE